MDKTYGGEDRRSFSWLQRRWNRCDFTFDEEHFMVDLVFYNRLLRCFVLFDLKIGMSHYLRLKYDKIERYGIKSC